MDLEESARHALWLLEWLEADALAAKQPWPWAKTVTDLRLALERPARELTVDLAAQIAASEEEDR